MKNIKFMMLTKIPGNFLQNIPNESININNIQYMFINIYTTIITPDQRIHKIKSQNYPYRGPPCQHNSHFEKKNTTKLIGDRVLSV